MSVYSTNWEAFKAEPSSFLSEFVPGDWPAASGSRSDRMVKMSQLTGIINRQLFCLLSLMCIPENEVSRNGY